MSSGLAISVLVVECYVYDDRDDISLYKTMEAIHKRLKANLEVSHPVTNEKLTKGQDDTKTKFIREKLFDAINKHLKPLFDDGCSRLNALKAWGNMFPHQFWKD